MAGWQMNPIMEWSVDEGETWTKITDHGRSPLRVSVERVESRTRMIDGTLRRYVVSKKRKISCSWDNLPDKTTSFLAGGQPGEWLEDFHDDNDQEFYVRFRSGSDIGAVLEEMDGEVIPMMITDFSKEVVKRGPAFDLWKLDIELEEV